MERACGHDIKAGEIKAGGNKNILYISMKMLYDKESNCIYNLKMQHVEEKSKLTECSRERCPLWKVISKSVLKASLQETAEN